MPEYRARGPVELQRVADVIRGLSPEKPWRITLTMHRKKRSSEQNRLYFAVLSEMANECGHSVEELHEFMKLKFLPRQIVAVGDEEMPIAASSSKLDTAAFSAFVEQVMAFASSELGVVV